MQIGIIGKGKMGKEIFNHFLNYDHSMVLICRNKDSVDTEANKIDKLLRKKLKRAYIDEITYEKKKSSIIVTDDLEKLKNCNIVIECIYEDTNLKSDIFEKVEHIVKEECILATNTSSIPLKDIFSKCKRKERCLGMHFFFPVKITKIVEINKTSYTESNYIDIAKKLLKDTEKEPLELEEEFNMILNKILSILMGEAVMTYKQNYLSMEEIDNILKGTMLRYGLFEIMNSIGIDIVINSFYNFNNFSGERYKGLFTDVISELKKISEKISKGENTNKSIFEYEKENHFVQNKLDETEMQSYKESILNNMQSILLNELAFDMKNSNVYKIKEGAIEVIGLVEDPADIIKRIGEESINQYLLDNYRRTKKDIYKAVDLSILSE